MPLLNHSHTQPVQAAASGEQQEQGGAHQDVHAFLTGPSPPPALLEEIRSHPLAPEPLSKSQHKRDSSLSKKEKKSRKHSSLRVGGSPTHFLLLVLNKRYLHPSCHERPHQAEQKQVRAQPTTRARCVCPPRPLPLPSIPCKHRARRTSCKACRQAVSSSSQYVWILSSINKSPLNRW